MEYIIRPTSKFSLNFRELWQYRELFFFFTWRDIKVKYKQTLLGFLWAILQPVLMMTVFVLFFSEALKLPTDNIPAPLFYFSGLLFWQLFNSGLNDAANSMVHNAEIIKKVYFPRLIIPFSGILVAFFDFLMASAVFAVILIYFKSTDSVSFSATLFLSFFTFSLLLTLITASGLGSLLAALNVKYRDFRYVLPFTLQFLLFVTPVIYPLSILGDLPVLQYLLALNPMTGAVTLSRAAFLSESVDPVLITISCGSAILLFLAGIYFFRKMEAYFADLA